MIIHNIAFKSFAILCVLMMFLLLFLGLTTKSNTTKIITDACPVCKGEEYEMAKKIDKEKP